MKTIYPSRGEILAKAMLKSFFGVDPQPQPRPLARQPRPKEDLLLPLRPDPAYPEMLKCHLPVWGRRDPDAPQVRSASISAKLARERPRRTRVIWLRKSAPDDWRRDLLRLVDDYEAGRAQFHPAGLLCDGDFCWHSQLAMSGR